MFYLIFLGLFSFVLLVDYFPLNNNGGKRNGFANIQIPVTEIFVHIGMFSLIIEEVYEVSGRRKRVGLGYEDDFFQFSRFYLEKRVHDARLIVVKYFLNDEWNILDLLAIVFYLIGFITRFFVIEWVFTVSK